MLTRGNKTRKLSLQERREIKTGKSGDEATREEKFNPFYCSAFHLPESQVEKQTDPLAEELAVMTINNIKNDY